MKIYIHIYVSDENSIKPNIDQGEKRKTKNIKPNINSILYAYYFTTVLIIMPQI